MFDLRRNVCYDKATVVMDAVWSGRVYSDMVQETRSNVGMVTLRCLRSIFWAVAVISSHETAGRQEGWKHVGGVVTALKAHESCQ
jgi:hypothetical protein